jgi:hypothetical protein
VVSTSESASGFEIVSNDTNPKTPAKFVAVLEFRQISRALVPVHADTLKEAEARADEIRADDVGQWKFAYDDVQVLEVRAAEDITDEEVDDE